jgi:argininosuccinate synthase
MIAPLSIHSSRRASSSTRATSALLVAHRAYSLYDQDLVTFEEGKVAYDHRDAAGFIRLNALRLRTLAQRRKKLKLDA